jgi:cell division protein FtsB
MIPNFKKNKRAKSESKESLFFSVILTIIFFVVIGFLVVSNIKISQKKNALNARIEVLRQEVQELQQKKHKLESQISQTDMESYLEEQARERFNLKKPGEEVVAFTKQKSEERDQQEQKTFWQKIREKLKF